MHKPRFDISPRLLSLVTLAAEIRAWINSAVVDVSWLPILQRETAARLAHSSTAIEGNPLTLPDVEALARGEEIGAKAKDKQEILNALAPDMNRKTGAHIKESDLASASNSHAQGPAGRTIRALQDRQNKITTTRRPTTSPIFTRFTTARMDKFQGSGASSCYRRRHSPSPPCLNPSLR